MSRQDSGSMDCRINSDGTVNINYSNGSSNAFKVISLDTFSQIITQDREVLELPMFPTNVRKYKKKGDNVYVAIEHPETIKDIVYNENNLKVPVPRSVWFHHLRVNTNNSERFSVIRQHVYALKMPLFSENQDMYAWPFPNYSTSYSPGICWGSDPNFREIKSNLKLTNLSSMFDMYFNAAFNDDLGWKFNIPDTGRDPQMLNNVETFSPDWLIEDSEGSNDFESALNRISR